MKKIKTTTWIGLFSCVLLAVMGILLLVTEETPKESSVQKGKQVVFSFQPEVLTYDGSGLLDLLKGVTVTEEGNPVPSDAIDAVLSSSDGPYRNIRYSYFDENRVRHTVSRQLQLVGYQGPSIQVASELTLDAQDWKDAAHVLADTNQLYAQDGFGTDVSDQVQLCRKYLEQSLYEITFSYRNQFGDQVQQTATAEITGELKDVVLELREANVTAVMGEWFDPMLYVQKAADPEFGDLTAQVTIEGEIDWNVPGTYYLLYQVYSYDKTQMAEQSLTVTLLPSVSEY